MIQQSTIGLASGAMPGIQAAGPTSGGAVFTSPSSASAASQENLLLPPSFNSQITQPEPLSSILQPSQSQSEESDSDPEDRMQVILEREAADFFGSVLSYKIFDIPIDKRDVVETIEFYNSIPLVPFIPSSIRKPEFTAKWASDALDQAGERIEKKLCPTIKALLLARGAAHGEAKTQIEDALTLVTAALQESRITRVAGRQGFAAARALREEMDDPLLTDYQKEVIKRAQPISTYRSSIGGRSRVRISQRRRFFGGRTTQNPTNGEELDGIEGETRVQADSEAALSGGSPPSRNTRGCHRRKNEILPPGMDRHASEENNLQRNQADLEREASQRKTRKRSCCRKRIHRHRNRARRMRALGKGRNSSKNSQAAEESRSQMSEQPILHPQEERKIPPSLGLSPAECRVEEHSLQDGRPTHCGEASSRGRLCNIIRPFASIFPDSSERIVHPVPCIQARRPVLRIRRHAIWNEGCTTYLHKGDARGCKESETEMERSLCFVPRRRAPPSPRCRRTFKDYERDFSVVRNTGFHHQQREERDSPKASVHLSGMDMEYEPDECVLRTGEEDELVCNVQEMGKDRYEKRASENEALCGICGINQCNQVCCTGCIPAHEYALRIPNQGSQEGGVGWIVPAQSQGLRPNSILANPSSPQQTTQTQFLPAMAGNSDNGCFSDSSWSNPANCSKEVNLPHIIQGGSQNTIIQLQGVASNITITPALPPTAQGSKNEAPADQIGQHVSSFQHQSLGGRKESEMSIEEDSQPCDKGTASCESSSYSGSEQYRSRRSVSPGASGRLPNKQRSHGRSSARIEGSTNHRRVRLKTKPQTKKVVRTRKPHMRRRSRMEVESGDSLGTSSNSAFASDASEDSSRESESNSAPTELERAGVESALGQVNDALHNLESQQLLFEAWNGNDSSGCNASTGTVHGSKVMVRQRGEQFYFRTAERNSIDNRIALEVKGSVCETTWTVYTYGYALFGKLTGFPDGIDCPKEWSSWIKGCCLSFISLRDNGISYSVLSQTRSAMSLISKLVFDKDLGEAAIVNSIFRSFARSHIPRTPYTSMWSPNQFFDFFERQPTNEQLTFYDLTLKCIVLCMLFSSCRFAELAAISMQRSIVTQDAIYLNTKMKTQLQRSFITIAAMRPDQEKICPYRAVLELWRRVKETYPHNDTFLLNTVVKTPLTVNGVRKLARRAMDQVGIPAEFRPYTLKAASISAYSLKGVPEVLIAHHARLSPTAHTPSRSYFKSNISSGMQQILAGPFPEAFSPQLSLNPMQTFQQALVPQPPRSISSDIRGPLAFIPQPPLASQPGEMPSITLNTTGQADCLLTGSPSHAIAPIANTQNELAANAIDIQREEKIGKIEATVTIRERETVRSKEITFISDGVTKPN